MNNNLLKEYLKEALNEEFFLRSYEEDSEDQKPKKSKNFLQQLKNFFFGDQGDSMVDEWLEDQSTSYDVEFSEEFEEEVRNFVKRKFKKALARARGNKEQASKLMRRALDIRYTKRLRDLEKQYAIDLADDET